MSKQANQESRIGIYQSAAGDRFECLYLSDQKKAIATKMPTKVGYGQEICKLEANSIEDAKEKLAQVIGPGSF